MSKFCTNCGKELKDNNSFCSYCGAQQNNEKKIYNQTNNVNQNNSLNNKKFPVWVIIIIAIVFLGLIGASDNSNDKKVTYNNNSSIKKEEVKVSFSEETIYEGHDVIIKVTGFEYTSSGIKLNIYIENNSSINLGFNAHSYGINGIMSRNNIYDMDVDVAAGKKANTSLEIKNSTLQAYNIDYIKYIDVLFWAYDNDKYFKEFETNVITIKSDKYDNSNSWISGKEIYNKSGIKVEFLYIDGDTIKYVVTNDTKNNLNITFDGISINGYTISDTDYSLFDEQVLKNNQIVFEINVDNDFKTTNKIDKISKVEFYLKYTENDNYEEYTTQNIITNIE